MSVDRNNSVQSLCDAELDAHEVVSSLDGSLQSRMKLIEGLDTASVEWTNHIKVLDLFSGMEGFSQAFEELGVFDVTTLEIEDEFDPDICADILDVSIDGDMESFDYLTVRSDDVILTDDWDIVLASPPCKTYSLAAISHHWKVTDDDERIPVSEDAEQSRELIEHTMELLSDIDPEYWVMENPRATLRKHNPPGHPEGSLTWCQFGADCQKATDLWGDIPERLYNEFEAFSKGVCKRGGDCHQSAPRGSKTGTQGKKNAPKRAFIPWGLSRTVAESMIAGLGGISYNTELSDTEGL